MTALALFTAVHIAGCAVALPPTRTEMGRSWRAGSAETQVAVGAHLASATGSETRPEVGVGLMYETASQGGNAKWRKGSYLDIGYAVLATKGARLIVGVRGERHHDGDLHIAKLRVDAEMFGRLSGGGAEASGCGAVIGGAFGNMGLGVFAEAGRAFSTGDRMFEHEVGWTASVGVTVRLPAVAALMIGGRGGSGSCSRDRSFSSGGSSNPLPSNH